MNLFNNPIFFPDATKGFVRSVDFNDLDTIGVKGILVNTYHLYKEFGTSFFKKCGGIKRFMKYKGLVISDSGGFQIGSLLKMYPGKGHISNNGALFKADREKQIMLTPEKSMEFQLALKTDLVVVLDDFTSPNASYNEAKISVERTIKWAYRAKKEYERILEEKKKQPLIIGVVQGGFYQDLRRYCTEELVKIGFDGLGYGGWPLRQAQGKLSWEFDYDSAKTIAKYTPKNYLLYGLGIGKPKQIIKLINMGYKIFDCVLPTRDARHGRAYISLNKTLNLTRGVFKNDIKPIDPKCACPTCGRYSRSYINYLFKVGDFSAGRLLTIHNLYFYIRLMDKIKA